jgi:predicted nucleotidyltransferase
MDDVTPEKLHGFFEKGTRNGVVSAYLFGSHSEGRAHRDSDVDIGVLLDRETFGTLRERFEAHLALIAQRKLERLPGFRNVLIHEYVTLDLDRVIEALDELEPIEGFFEIVRRAQ